MRFELETVLPIIDNDGYCYKVNETHAITPNAKKQLIPFASAPKTWI